jgi:hypothetical protein
MTAQVSVDRTSIHQNIERARATFHQLLDEAAEADLSRRSNGTRWTNEQLLFHMLFGYMIVRALLPPVRVFGRLPDRASRLFANLLNGATRPFHFVNYLGSCGGAKVFNRRRMGPKLDHVIDSLHRSLNAEPEERLWRAMHFPTHWDPYFKDTMTLAEVYQYATQHFDHHRRQLTL